MQLEFLGATDTVTGSRFLVTEAGSRVLVDCGLFQGVKRLRLRNREPFPVAPSSLEAVVLTHAHLDHSGHLPALVRDGFAGRVWCTPLTAQLTEVLLRDAAYLAEEEARHHNRHGTSRHRPAEPLYTRADAEAAIARLHPLAFDQPAAVTDQFTLRFTRVGHILGAASVHLASPSASVAVTGDVGRPDDPVMLPPEPLPAADAIITESTYGDRTHPDVDVGEELAAVVNRTVERGGTVLIPSFAVGRAQALLHLLTVLRTEGRIPDVPVHLNSPMAVDVTELLVEALGEHRLGPGACRALWSGVEVHRSASESKQLTAMDGPRIVITASGMVTGGRVLHHLVQLAPDPGNTILLPGFQAVGTRGRDIQEGAPTVRVFGEPVRIRAEVVTLQALSAHADADQLVAWLGQTPAPTSAHVVHGEPAASDALRRRLRHQLGWSVGVPALGDVVDVRPR